MCVCVCGVRLLVRDPRLLLYNSPVYHHGTTTNPQPPLLPPSVPFNPGTVTDALYTEAAAAATARLGFEVTGMDLKLAGLSYRAVPGMSDDDLEAKILAARSKRAEGGAWRGGVLCVRCDYVRKQQRRVSPPPLPLDPRLLLTSPAFACRLCVPRVQCGRRPPQPQARLAVSEELMGGRGVGWVIVRA